MKRFIDIHIPVSACNLRCEYCYVGQLNARNTEKTVFKYSPEYIGKALSRERLGGICHFNMCGMGETLIPPEITDITYELLKQGHFIMIVTNGLLTKKLERFAEFPEEYRKRLGFKFSFHYSELKKYDLTEKFFNNVNLVRKNGMSFSAELTPCDSLEPYIDDIKRLCMENLGALCHVTIPRDMTKQGLVLLSERSFEEFCGIWSAFDSPMFDFKKSVWEQKRTEFCYAGKWSGLLDIGSGNLEACYSAGFSQNIFSDISKPINFTAVGCNCRLPHCYNSHSLLGLGTIPEIDGCTYAEERDRIDVRDGSHWLQPEMSEFLSHKLYDYNDILSDSEKKKNELKRKAAVLKNYRRRVKSKIKRIIKADARTK